MKKIMPVVMAVLLAAAVLGSSVNPRLVEGNPTCEDAGYFGEEYKVDKPGTSAAGSYDVDNNGVNETTVTTADGKYFNWTSSIGMDAVISKGGDAANVYDYNPEAFSDTNLHSPVNPSGNPADISHITFCFDLESDPQEEVPEFTVIGAGIALAGAGLVIARRRKD